MLASFANVTLLRVRPMGNVLATRTHRAMRA
jgi:hypothetical protein